MCRICLHLQDIHRGDVLVFSDPHPEPGVDRGPVGALLHWLGKGFGVAQPEDKDYIKRVVGLAGRVVGDPTKVSSTSNGEKWTSPTWTPSRHPRLSGR